MNVTGGSIDVTTYFVLRLAASGVEATGLTITNFDLQYTRTGAAPTAKVDATALAAADSAHSDNCAFEVDATDQPGLYRVDWPDAAFAAGVKQVILTVKCATCFTEHMVVDIDPPVNVTKISDDSTAADNCEAMFDGTGYAGGTAKLKVDLETIKTQTVTCTAGVTVLASVGTAATSTAQTGDSYARLGAPAGASVSADIADLHTDVADVHTDLATVDGILDDIHGTDLPAVKSDTADIHTDLATVDGIVDAIKLKTDNIPASPAAVSDIPTAAANADAVWNETLADHLTAGSTGAALNAAGSAGDPWNTAIPGAYGAGTAGKIVGDNLNAPVGTIDTVVDGLAASLATVDGILDDIHGTDLPAVKTDTAAIKAKTDNLPASPAAVGSAMALTSGERNSTADALLVRALAAESYATDGGTPTLSQILWMIWAMLAEPSISGVTMNVKNQAGSIVMTFTLDDGTNPTSRTRAS